MSVRVKQIKNIFKKNQNGNSRFKQSNPSQTNTITDRERRKENMPS